MSSGSTSDPRNADLVERVCEIASDYTLTREQTHDAFRAIIAEAERRGAAKEREACAEIADTYVDWEASISVFAVSQGVAAAIRARAEQEAE